MQYKNVIFFLYNKMLGTCVLTGHEDGTVLAWGQDGSYLDLLATHLRAVTDIALISYFGKCNKPLFYNTINN